jgi:hypothetical protein
MRKVVSASTASLSIGTAATAGADLGHQLRIDDWLTFNLLEALEQLSGCPSRRTNHVFQNNIRIRVSWCLELLEQLESFFAERNRGSPRCHPLKMNESQRARKEQFPLVLFGLLAVGLFLLLWSRSGPSYGGQRISARILQLDDTDASRRQEAQTALQRLGCKGRAWMVRRLNREEPRVDKILRGDRSSGRLTDYDLRRASMATALASLGPAAVLAIPALELAAQHSDWLIAARAQAALIQIRQESSLPFRQSLTNR